MKKLTLHRVHRVTTFVQVKRTHKHLNGTKRMATKKFTVKQIAKAKEFFKENPNGAIKIDWATNWTKADFDRWFMDCLNNKINSHLPVIKSKKLDLVHIYFVERLARNLANRVRVYSSDVPRCYLKRLAHRIS